MKDLMISVAGVRGIIGEGLTPDIVTRFAAAFGVSRKRGKIIVGRDTRVSGASMEYAVFAGLTAVGCDVQYIGISTTPTVQIAVEKLKADGGIAITASHNPQQWNALKFIDNRGMFLNTEAGNEVLALAESPNPGYAVFSNLGTVKDIGSFDAQHIEAVLASEVVDQQSIKINKFKVVVDCVNGAGSFILPELLTQLGCDVTTIFCKPDGKFPRGAEPMAENLTALSNKVKEVGADVGFACDPDGDRLAIIDETGRPLGEEYTLALAVKHLLSRKKGSIAANVSTTAVLDEIAASADVPLYRSKVGEAHVVAAMLENDCLIGGEGNGGVIFPEVHYGRDAIVGIALVLQLLTDEMKPLSAVYDALPRYYMSKQKIDLVGITLEEALQKVSTDEFKIDRTDGIKILFKDSWIHLRGSNTEPIIRVMAEARSEQKANELTALYKKIILGEN